MSSGRLPPSMLALRAAWVVRVARLLLAVMGLAALAPAVSHALAGERQDAWTVVCTSQGVRLVPSAALGEEPGTAGNGGAFEHCPFCTPGHGAAPPPAPPVLARIAPAHEVPALFLSAPRTLHAWLGAQPRAPPSFI